MDGLTTIIAEHWHVYAGEYEWMCVCGTPIGALEFLAEADLEVPHAAHMAAKIRDASTVKWIIHLPGEPL